MSRQQRPTRAILAKNTDQRLAALIRRFGGVPYTAPKPGVVELPSDAWYRQRFGDVVSGPRSVDDQDDDWWSPPEYEPDC